MVFTLHRYIFRELLRVFILAALALTLMVSLGSILQPVQKYGVGPQQVLHFMGYFLPVTLTFVLPIAALFASTLVYGRLAGDNELDACRASGISFLTLVYPGFLLAVMVAIANLLLSFHVMPAFVLHAQKSIKADAKQILFRNIQRKGFYKLPPDERYLIYADLADAKNNTLSGVVVVDAEGGDIGRIITTEAAKIGFSPHERFNEVQITAWNAYQLDVEDSYSLGLIRFSHEFSSLLADSIKFKNIDQMKQIRDVDMMLFDPIAREARRVHAQLIAELICRDIKAKITSEVDSYYKLHSADKFIYLTAVDCRVPDNGERRLELNRELVVMEAELVREDDTIEEKPLRTLRAEKGVIYVEGDDLSPTLTLELYNPIWQTADGKVGHALRRTRIRGLLLPESVGSAAAGFKNENGLMVRELMDAKPFGQEHSAGRFRSLQTGLDKEVRDTLAEIDAEIHIRLVFGIGCVVMILIGIGLGVIEKGGHPLAAFGISCIPTALLLVFMLMGKNVMTNSGVQSISGVALMWMGLVLLCVLAVAVYQRLLRT